MTDILPMHNEGTLVYPLTHVDAVIGLDSHLSVWATANGTLIYNTVKDLIGTTSGQPGAASQIIDGGNSTTNGRAVNSPPSYYQTNYPAKEVREFKQTANVGVTLIDGQTSDYGILSTRVPGTDTGFGRPRQTFEPTLSARPLTYVRIGISDTAWSDWELTTTW